MGGWKGNFTQPPDSINSPYTAAAIAVGFTFPHCGECIIYSTNKGNIDLTYWFTAGMHSSQCQCTIPYFNNGLILDPSIEERKLFPGMLISHSQHAGLLC